MANPGLFIKVGLHAQQFFAGITNVRGALNLLASSLRAVFRTAVVAGFFMVLRSVYTTISGITNSVKSLTKEFMDLNLAGAKTATIITKGGAGTKSAFEEVTKQARALSTQVGYTAAQIQEGFYTAAIAGFNLSDSIKVSTSAMRLAQIGGMEFGDTTNNLIGIVNAFQISLSELPRISTLIAASFTNSKMVLADFFNAMKYVSAATVATFGESQKTFTDTSAALMTMQDAGLGASQAGTYLRASIMKLQGSTSKALQIFAKYGVELYENTSASAKYFGTLKSGQAALADYYEKLNTLKQRQLDLVISGKQESEMFKKVTKEVDELQTKITTLESGLDDVYTQFSQAGGKLKNFETVLKAISGTVPVEAIGKAFGIRGGMGIQVLLNNMPKFQKHLATLEEANRLYDEGNDILSNMFAKVVDSISITWMKLGNTVKSMFSVIFDAVADPANELLGSLLKGFQRVYKFIEGNKGVFKSVFKDLAAGLKPIIDVFNDNLMNIISKIALITGRSSFKVPKFGMEKGMIETVGETEVSGSKSPMQKLSAITSSLLSLLSAAVKVIITELTDVISAITETIAGIVIFTFNRNLDIFYLVGKEMAKGLFTYLNENSAEISKNFESAIDRAMKAISDPKNHEAWQTIGKLIAKGIWGAIAGTASGVVAATPGKGVGKLAAISPLVSIAAMLHAGSLKVLDSTGGTDVIKSLFDKLASVIIKNDRALKQNLNSAIIKIEGQISSLSSSIAGE